MLPTLCHDCKLAGLQISITRTKIFQSAQWCGWSAVLLLPGRSQTKEFGMHDYRLVK